MSNLPLLTRIFINPEKLGNLGELEWDLLVRQARSSNLLGKINVLINEHDLINKVPSRVQPHLLSEGKYFQAHKESVLWEIENLKKALRNLGSPVVLLKGAAYLASGQSAGEGRLFNDIDILVRREYLEEAEKYLYKSGWMTTHLNEYDQKYYRKWMHELPPLKHYQRKTSLDVHHNILPVTATAKPDSEKLLKNSIPLDQDELLRVLSPEDMVIHSATHLFHEGELDHGLRDLLDIDSLVTEYGSKEFWYRLIERAFELDLVWPVYYALYFLRKILLRIVPEDIFKKLKTGLKGLQGRGFVMLAYEHAFLPNHPSCGNLFMPISRWFLYLRGHWLRMPIYLLLPHLFRKAISKKDSSEI